MNIWTCLSHWNLNHYFNIQTRLTWASWIWRISKSMSYDRQTNSNSLSFELERGWNGILIEAIKPLFKWLIDRKRHAYSINACIADKVQVGKMLHFGVETLSGLDMMGEKYKVRGMRESGQRVNYIFSPCFSLVTILTAIDVKKVDYFSLDVEGLISLGFFRRFCNKNIFSCI